MGYPVRYVVKFNIAMMSAFLVQHQICKNCFTGEVMTAIAIIIIIVAVTIIQD